MFVGYTSVHAATPFSVANCPFRLPSFRRTSSIPTRFSPARPSGIGMRIPPSFGGIRDLLTPLLMPTSFRRTFSIPTRFSQRSAAKSIVGMRIPPSFGGIRDLLTPLLMPTSFRRTFSESTGHLPRSASSSWDCAGARRGGTLPPASSRGSHVPCRAYR